MDQGEARRTLEQCLQVLYYRDCRTINKVFVLLIFHNSEWALDRVLQKGHVATCLAASYLHKLAIPYIGKL